ncbi:MAG: hypothetical protein IJZ29_01610 [Clostridia bacterium]|nr:hypothetical protein [Clostridia bacterium]
MAKCKICGANVNSKFCEYCGAKNEEHIDEVDMNSLINENAKDTLGADYIKCMENICNLVNYDKIAKETGSYPSEFYEKMPEMMANTMNMWGNLNKEMEETSEKYKKARADIAKKICPSCGAKFKKGEDFCEKCGASLLIEEYHL